MAQLWRRMQRDARLRQAGWRGALDSLRASGTRAAPVAAPCRAAGSRAPRAALLLRDNLRNRAPHRARLPRAIGRARDEIIIANAYFVPGAQDAPRAGSRGAGAA